MRNLDWWIGMYTCIDGVYRICRGDHGSYSDPVLQLYTDPTDEEKVDKYLYGTRKYKL